MGLIRLLERIVILIKFYGKAQTLHHIHSPFLYQFIEHCFDRKRLYYDFIKISQAYYRMSANYNIIPGGNYERMHRQAGLSISELHQRASAPLDQCETLYRIVQYAKPKHILELGSCLGLSGLSMKLAAPNAKLSTIEGSKFLAEECSRLFYDFGLYNSNCIHAHIEDFLKKPILPPAELVYLDASHTYHHSIDFIHSLLTHHTTADAIVLMDDIHWSADMYKAWNEIILWPSVQCSLETHRMGILFKSRALTPGRHTWIAMKYKPWNLGAFH